MAKDSKGTEMDFSRARIGATFPALMNESLVPYGTGYYGSETTMAPTSGAIVNTPISYGYQGIMNIMSGMSMFGFTSLIVSDWADCPCERTSMDHGTMIPPIGLWFEKTTSTTIFCPW